jgi:hypothetical protein
MPTDMTSNVFAEHQQHATNIALSDLKLAAIRASLLGVVNLDLLGSLVHVDVSSSGILAIEDLGDLFESGAFGLDEDEVDPDGLDAVPELENC